MSKNKDWSKAEKEEFFWILAAAYLMDTVGLLDKDKAAKLASLEAQAGPESWQEQVRSSLEMDDDFVKQIVALFEKREKDKVQSLVFILRGLGCPCAEQRLMELS